MVKAPKYLIETFNEVIERVPNAEPLRHFTIRESGAEFFELIDTIDGYIFHQFIQNGTESALYVFRRID